CLTTPHFTRVGRRHQGPRPTFTRSYSAAFGTDRTTAGGQPTEAGQAESAYLPRDEGLPRRGPRVRPGAGRPDRLPHPVREHRLQCRPSTGFVARAAGVHGLLGGELDPG